MLRILGRDSSANMQTQTTEVNRYITACVSLFPPFWSVSKPCHLPLPCVSQVIGDLEASYLSDMALPAQENAAEYSQFKNGGDTSAAENNIIAI